MYHIFLQLDKSFELVAKVDCKECVNNIKSLLHLGIVTSLVFINMHYAIQTSENYKVQFIFKLVFPVHTYTKVNFTLSSVIAVYC